MPNTNEPTDVAGGVTDRCQIPGCTNPGVERFPDPCWSSSTLVCEEHRSRFQPSAFDQAAVRLARCEVCKGTGIVNEWLGTKCRSCHGTGLDPEKVEMLRGIERAVIERCAATLAPYEFRAQDCGDRLVIKLTAAECAAAIEGMAAKPAGG